MKLILNCTNLLGDSLYLLRPIQAYLEQYPNTVEAIIANSGLAWDMFNGCFEKEIEVYDNLDVAKGIYPEAVVLEINAGMAGDIAFKHSQKTKGPPLHISEAYGQLLGCDLHNNLKPLTDWAVIKEALPRTFIAISPFSKSCSRHTGEIPNKTLDDHKWEYIIRYLRRQNIPVKVIAGPGDRLKVNSVPMNDYFTADNLYELEHFLKQCALLVTVDNGLGHLASILNTPMIYLWPGVSSLDFIYPRFGNTTCCVQIGDPNQAAPAAMLTGIRMYTQMILGDRHVTERIQE
jgi:hypothetical protein